ncbi:MAG: S8 family serine peptidase [Candidatus Limnocylindria bacterium]
MSRGGTPAHRQGVPGASRSASCAPTGNSFAAPHVAGMVALILSKHPGLAPFEVKAILAAIADNPRRPTRTQPGGHGEGR